MPKLRFLSPVYYLTVIAIFAVAAIAAYVIDRTNRDADRVFAAVVLLSQMNNSLVKATAAMVVYAGQNPERRKLVAGEVQNELSVFSNRWGDLRNTIVESDAHNPYLFMRDQTVTDYFDRFIKLGYAIVADNSTTSRSPSYGEFLRLARRDVQDIITTAIGGKPATHVYEGERRFQLILRFPEAARNSVSAIGDIRVHSGSGAPIPMSDLAKIEIREGPARISREQVRRRIYIGFNVVGRDIGGVVDEGRKKLASQLRLPEGHRVTWGGAFENMERANARLLIVVPVTLGLVFFLLFWAFHSLRYATLIIMNLPFALIGGVVSLWLSGQYLSVPASIGFIELFGLAVGNGIVLVSYINQLRNEGTQMDEAIITGCSLRLRPVVMTMMTTLLGLLPLALAQGIGAEVQRPLATVVIGGLFSSTALTLVVLPALYRWFAETEVGKEHAPEWV